MSTSCAAPHGFGGKPSYVGRPPFMSCIKHHAHKKQGRQKGHHTKNKNGLVDTNKNAPYVMQQHANHVIPMHIPVNSELFVGACDSKRVYIYLFMLVLASPWSQPFSCYFLLVPESFRSTSRDTGMMKAHEHRTTENTIAIATLTLTRVP